MQHKWVNIAWNIFTSMEVENGPYYGPYYVHTISDSV